MGEVGCLKDGCFQNLQVEGKCVFGGTTHFDDPHVEKTRAVAVSTDAVTAVNGDMLVITVVNPGAILLPPAKKGAKIRLFSQIGNTSAFTVTAPGPSGRRYDVLSVIAHEDNSADAPNTTHTAATSANNTLTVTAAGIGTQLTFVSDGLTYFVFGELAAIDGTLASAAFSTV